MLQKKCDECWLMGYCVPCPTHPLIPHIASSTASTFMHNENACFSQITMHPFKYTSVGLSPIPIFPQCSERISIAKTIQEMHIRELRVSRSSICCCCHSYCYSPHLVPKSWMSRSYTSSPSAPHAQQILGQTLHGSWIRSIGNVQPTFTQTKDYYSCPRML
jgi:hypothetical protein